MKIDTARTAKAIQEMEAKGERVTLKAISKLTGYTYGDLYNSRLLNKYVRPSLVAKNTREFKRANPFSSRIEKTTPLVSEPNVEVIEKVVPAMTVEAGPVTASIPMTEQSEKYFPYDASCNLVWRTGSQDKFGLIQIKGLTADDDFNLDIFAFMLLKAYNRVTGRKGEARLVHEPNKISFKD